MRVIVSLIVLVAYQLGQLSNIHINPTRLIEGQHLGELSKDGGFVVTAFPAPMMHTGGASKKITHGG
jgi:hypothetical protein